MFNNLCGNLESLKKADTFRKLMHKLILFVGRINNVRYKKS